MNQQKISLVDQTDNDFLPCSHYCQRNTLEQSIDSAKSCVFCCLQDDGQGSSGPNSSDEATKDIVSSVDRCHATLGYFNEIPCVILAVIESYLQPSSIVSLTLTCKRYHKRWTTNRWRKTFDLHYGITRRHHPNQKWFSLYVPSSSSTSLSTLSSIQNRYNYFYKKRYGSWQNSFVCDVGDVDDCLLQHSHLEHVEYNNTSNTKFNHNSLFPSLKRHYKSLWLKIELSMLGLELPSPSNDSQNDHTNQNFGYFPRQQRHNFTAFATVTKVIKMLLSPLLEYVVITFFPTSDFVGWRSRKKNKSCTEGNMDQRCLCLNKSTRFQLNNIDNMNAWKLACLLKERGMNCICCRICDEIDLVGNSDLVTWMTPCRCVEPVHRKCLEEKLGLVQSLYLLERTKLFLRKWSWKINCEDTHPDLSPLCNVAPKMWVSYDEPIHNTSDGINSPVDVDAFDKFTSPISRCTKCGVQYSRALRLPRTIPEVVFSTLSDRLALSRAISTFAHFILCVGFIAAVEANCVDNESCSNDLIDVNLSGMISFKWPALTWKGIALVWWQLQQCCMLHIFFSARFVAIVDRLWLHSGSTFYVKLYVYFVFSSLLMACFIPSFCRMIERNMLSAVISDHLITFLSPLWDFVLFLNLCQYAVSSTTVIIIFWRTNYRIFTIAERKETKSTLSQAIHQTEATNLNNILDLTNNMRNLNDNVYDHPIYHGRWE